MTVYELLDALQEYGSMTYAEREEVRVYLLEGYDHVEETYARRVDAFIDRFAGILKDD